MKRMFIYPKDIMLLMGVSIQHARKVARDIKKKHNRKGTRFVTVYEFCEFYNLPPEEVLAELDAGRKR